jgi:hypothetical protein
MWRFGIGTLPAALLILGNNYLTTGSAVSVAYGANATFPEMTAANWLGFGWPDPEVMLGLLWGEYRGLFFWCPALILSLAGVIELLRRDRRLAVMTIAAITLVLLQVGAFYGAFGGNAIGPRYLAPALPFIGLATAYGMKRYPEAGLALLIVSIVSMGLVTAIAIDPPGDVMRPLELFYLVRLRDGRFADNLGTLIGIPLFLSLALPLLPAGVAAWYVMRRRVTAAPRETAARAA